MSEEKNWYLEHELYPAIEFSKTEEGRDWIENHFPYLVERIYEKGDELLGYEYLVGRGGVPLYIGEALKPARLLVHLMHLHDQPELYFGVDAEEIESGLVEISILETGILDIEARRARELELRKQYKPILNPAELGDKCIPRKERYGEVHKWYNDIARLGKAIEIAVYQCPFAFGWNEVLRRTPCCDYGELEIPYGLEKRISEYLDSLDKEEYCRLSNMICYLVGNGYHVTKYTLIKVLSRLLSGMESEEDVLKMGIMAARAQIMIREQFLKNCN